MMTRFRSNIAIWAILFVAVFSMTSGGPLDEPLYPYLSISTCDNCRPRYVVGADLDNDGNQDLVVSADRGRSFALLFGRGNGLFDRSFIQFPSDVSPVSVAVGDFDSNGTQDLAATTDSLLNVGVAVYEGNGDRSFSGPTGYYGAYHFVTTGDFNGDDHIDLILPGRLLMNYGQGSFIGPFTVPLDGNEAVAVADFNGDGYDDYATTRNAYLGDGMGVFVHSSALPAGIGDNWVATGDLSGDGIPDVVVSFETSEIAVVLGNGDGTFESEQRYAVGIEPVFVSIADVDKDGLSDVVVAHSLSGDDADDTVMLLYGSGGGALEPAVVVAGLAVLAQSVVVADFDNDGLNDLAVPSSYSDDVRLVLANGPRSFPTNPSFDVGVGVTARAIAIGDVDRDGRPDLATANSLSDDLSVLVANGAGSFAPEIRIPAGDRPSSLVLAELTSDAHLDLAVANAGSGNVSIHAGNGDGTFATLGPVEVGLNPSTIVSGDLDNDDHLDLVVANFVSSTISTLLGAGDGTFTPMTPPVAVGIAPRDLALGDFDGDQVLDLVAVHEMSDDAWVLLGGGDGTFAPAPVPFVYPGGDFPKSVEVADLDTDGNLDFVVKSVDDLRVYLGNGDATFTAGAFHLLEGVSVVATDADGDGILDLAIGGPPYSRQFRILVGIGNGTFSAGSVYTNGGDVVVPGDFDLDGRMDLVGGYYSKVWLSLNQAGPNALNFLADGATLAWPTILGALSYDIYRGNLWDLVDPDGDGLPENGYGVCLSGLDDDTRDTYFVDPEVPTPAGAGFFYLKSVTDAQGDSGLGTNSAGQTRLPQVPCP